MRQYTCIEQEKRWLIQLPELTGCVEKIEPQVTIDLMPYSPYLDRNEKINFLGESFNLSDHSCPQRPCSFWSAPRVAASSWVWFSEHVQRIRFVLSAYQTCQIWLWVCTKWQEVCESWTSGVGPSQRWFLVLTKRSVACGDKNAYQMSLRVFFHKPL